MELTPQQEHILRNAINKHNNRIRYRTDKLKWQEKLITVESIKKDLDKGEKFNHFVHLLYAQHDSRACLMSFTYGAWGV